MTKIKLKDALKIYREKVSILKKGYAQERFRLHYLISTFLGDLFVDEVTSVDIATYRDQRLESINIKTNKKISAATVRLELSLLSNFFDVARIEWGFCEGNPVKNVRKPKAPPGRDRRLTSRELKLILRYCHNHRNSELQSIIVFALETAMRQGEILSLKWENINLNQRVACLPDTKNGTRRDVPLSLRARDMLLRLGQKQTGKVFTYTSSGIKSTWRLMLERLEIEDLHFHDLRHEAISLLFEKGTLDMMEIAAISGHKSLSMLKRYTHLRAQKLVRKLEAPKQKGRAAILNNLVPYPAEIFVRNGKFVIRILDFEKFEVEGDDYEKAVEYAQDKLLRKIILEMKYEKSVTAPNQYLEPVPQDRITMIDPLAENHFDTLF
ncbi:Tyrosine recombinase XerC [Comamonas aquatica]|uniref:site-specific integrase n=1 Tax=Comamonas aquatica TaxID=225991 RepID=UPI001EF39B6D|nr:site-specific integrase [Comamonas aquatica]CAB5681751.1 Tyrosine recombinase XerC [Comamonas aquatica]CAC9217396.1 Tyrosine recombinase XerC [Comamonas aquatica]